jgi:hypothetical protein
MESKIIFVPISIYEIYFAILAWHPSNFCKIWKINLQQFDKWEHLQEFAKFYLTNLVFLQLLKNIPRKKQFIYNNLA